jgi:hypothetical protein
MASGIAILRPAAAELLDVPNIFTSLVWTPKF